MQADGLEHGVRAVRVTERHVGELGGDPRTACRCGGLRRDATEARAPQAVGDIGDIGDIGAVGPVGAVGSDGSGTSGEAGAELPGTRRVASRPAGRDTASRSRVSSPVAVPGTSAAARSTASAAFRVPSRGRRAARAAVPPQTLMAVAPWRTPARRDRGGRRGAEPCVQLSHRGQKRSSRVPAPWITSRTRTESATCSVMSPRARPSTRAVGRPAPRPRTVDGPACGEHEGEAQRLGRAGGGGGETDRGGREEHGADRGSDRVREEHLDPVHVPHGQHPAREPLRAHRSRPGPAGVLGASPRCAARPAGGRPPDAR